MLKMRPFILPCTIIFLLLFSRISWSAITDTTEKLVIPEGESYTLGGTRTYTQSIEVFGTIFVKAYNTTSDSGYLELTAPNVIISTSGKIDAGGRGYRGGPGIYDRGEGPGGGSCGLNGGGAAYGGESKGTVSYGSITQPKEMGSGGGGGNGRAGGGSGGGRIKIVATEILIINGTINANGNSGGYSDVLGNGGGGGSGGCVYIDTKKLSGNGTVTANGGSGDIYNSNAGGGAGGRIAVYCQTDDFTGIITAYADKYRYGGGIPSGAGTIFRKSAEQTYGTLTISNNGKSGERTNISGQFDTVTVTSCAITVATATTKTNELNVNNTGIFYSSANVVVQMMNIDSNGSVYAQNEQLSVDNVCDINSAKLWVNSPVIINNLKIEIGGILTHSKGASNFDVKVLGDLDLMPGGKIDVSGCGYLGGTFRDAGIGKGPGGGGAGWCYGGGGAYGGNGANGVSRPGIFGGAGGEMYGSPLEPAEMGSGGGGGGGNDTPGGDGGGKIKLFVSGTLSNDGIISANGIDGGSSMGSGYSGGGGAGGSINILANILSGNGTISANGGNAGNSCAGGGSGGRIFIACNSFSFPGNIEAKAGIGGATSAGAGSIITPLSNPDPTVNQSDTSVNYMQSSSLNETVSIQSVQFSLNVSGKLSGTMNFADAKMTTIKTGAFNNKGFLKANWNGQLEGVNYTGLLKAAVYLDVNQRRLYVKGAMEGSIKGAVDGYLAESLPQSGTYDQFVATWTFKYPLPGGQYSCGRSALQGTCICSQNQEYSGVNLKYMQASSLGNVSGSYTGSINTVLTSVLVNDVSCSSNGEGFCTIDYQTGADEGQIWCFSTTLINDEAELSGMVSDPLFGILQGTLLNRESEKKLWLIISKIDIASEPKADLQLDVFSLNKVSPGATVSYTIRVKNNGIVPAENIKVQMSLPLEARFLAASGDYWYLNGAEGDFVKYPTPEQGPETISWLLPTVSAKGTYIFNVQAKTIWGIGSGKELNAEVGIFNYDPDYFKE